MVVIVFVFVIDHLLLVGNHNSLCSDLYKILPTPIVVTYIGLLLLQAHHYQLHPRGLGLFLVLPSVAAAAAVDNLQV